MIRLGYSHILSAVPLLGLLPLRIAHPPHLPYLAAQTTVHTGPLSLVDRTFRDVHMLGALSLAVFGLGELPSHLVFRIRRECCKASQLTLVVVEYVTSFSCLHLDLLKRYLYSVYLAADAIIKTSID